jgi:hypothetical protein
MFFFLVRKDDYAFFLKPVDVEKVPGYLEVISQPMDFGTMTEKVAKSKYRSLDEFAVRTRPSLSPPSFSFKGGSPQPHLFCVRRMTFAW